MTRILCRMQNVTMALVVLLLTLSFGNVLAKTPDGVTPAEEQVCSGLKGAAFGLCNAYCEAQDCDVHPRPSCEQLRFLFARVTGDAIFPCDVQEPVCGNGAVEAGEQCDDGNTVSEDGCSATCQDEFCGDNIVQSGLDEECEPPDSQGTCSGDLFCDADCQCGFEG